LGRTTGKGELKMEKTKTKLQGKGVVQGKRKSVVVKTKRRLLPEEARGDKKTRGCHRLGVEEHGSPEAWTLAESRKGGGRS